MHYFDEMTSKWGFADGEAIPFGIEHYRKVYVEAINVLAAKYGSNFRAAEFDRTGLHNWCLIVFRELGSPEKMVEQTETDEGMQKAICIARDLEVDSHVATTVKVRKGAFGRIQKDGYSRYARELEEQYYADEA